MLLANFTLFFVISYWINLFIFNDAVYASFNIPKDTFVGFSLTLFTIGPVSLVSALYLDCAVLNEGDGLHDQI